MIQFSVRLPKEDNEKLEQLARSLGRSKNGQVVFILKNVLKDYDRFLKCTNTEVTMLEHPVKRVLLKNYK